MEDKACATEEPRIPLEVALETLVNGTTTVSNSQKSQVLYIVGGKCEYVYAVYKVTNRHWESGVG